MYTEWKCVFGAWVYGKRRQIYTNIHMRHIEHLHVSSSKSFFLCSMSLRSITPSLHLVHGLNTDECELQCPALIGWLCSIAFHLVRCRFNIRGLYLCGTKSVAHREHKTYQQTWALLYDLEMIMPIDLHLSQLYPWEQIVQSSFSY